MQVQSRRSASGARQCLDLEMPAVSDALTDVRSAFADLPVPASVLDDARLLVSELVGNSMRHARLGPNDTIRVAVEIENGTLRVDVIDGGRGGAPPVAGGIRPTPGAESGWGLYLVETLATRWGHGAGRYWFELEIDGSTSPG
jgi:anti-sigma regulatory factor (Ser/Thr protein kinase)